MTESRPHLVAVEGDASQGSSPAPAAASEGRARRGGTALWIAAGLALICAIGWFASARNGRALAEELRQTQASLLAAQDRVGALEGQLVQVQERTGGLVDDMARVMGQLGALAGDLEALGALAGSDPQLTAAEPEAPLSSEMAPAD